MNNKDIAKKVVDRIVDMIQTEGCLPWVKPWSRKVNTVEVIDGYKVITIYPRCWNRKGIEYKGANMYLPHGEYITFNQCKAEGGQVKKGAKGYPVVYWNFYTKTEKNPLTGDDEDVTIPILKYYTVFNVKDCDGIKQKHNPKPEVIKIPVTHSEPVAASDRDLNAAAEAIIADYVSRAGNGFHIKRNEITDKACYYPGFDYVSIPMREQFQRISEYYSTLFHELGHSTGHSSRLNRFTGKAACAAFGSQEYSKEELVAEATAASILNALGMEDANSFRNSAAYIKSWASHIKNDPMMYISAMTKAQAAFDMIVGIDVTASPDPGDGDRPETEKPETVETEKPVENVQVEKPVEAVSKKQAANQKKRIAAAERLLKSSDDPRCGWYKLNTPEDEPAQMIVTPYLIVMADELELTADYDRSRFEKIRADLTKRFEDIRFDSKEPMSVTDSLRIKTLPALIAEDKKNRKLSERKNNPLRFDFGDGKPMVNAVWLNEILTIIGSDDLTIRYSGELKPLYLNNNGNEAILFPMRKK